MIEQKLFEIMRECGYAAPEIAERAQLLAHKLLERFEEDANRYAWIKNNIKETPVRPQLFNAEICPDTRLKYELPILISYNAIGQQISLDKAIDYQRNNNETARTPT